MNKAFLNKDAQVLAEQAEIPVHGLLYPIGVFRLLMGALCLPSISSTTCPGKERGAGDSSAASLVLS